MEICGWKDLDRLVPLTPHRRTTLHPRRSRRAFLLWCETGTRFPISPAPARWSAISYSMPARSIHPRCAGTEPRRLRRPPPARPIPRARRFRHPSTHPRECQNALRFLLAVFCALLQLSNVPLSASALSRAVALRKFVRHCLARAQLAPTAKTPTKVLQRIKPHLPRLPDYSIPDLSLDSSLLKV